MQWRQEFRKMSNQDLERMTFWRRRPKSWFMPLNRPKSHQLRVLILPKPKKMFECLKLSSFQTSSTKARCKAKTLQKLDNWLSRTKNPTQTVASLAKVLRVHPSAQVQMVMEGALLEANLALCQLQVRSYSWRGSSTSRHLLTMSQLLIHSLCLLSKKKGEILPVIVSYSSTPRLWPPREEA